MDAKVDRRELLRRIQELEFVAVDLNLYLDTHPNETAPLEHFNRVACELREAKKEYEKCYGPLLNFGFSENAGNRWLWIDEPWPWDM